jgi:hypothetical protein
MYFAVTDIGTSRFVFSAYACDPVGLFSNIIDNIGAFQTSLTAECKAKEDI